MNLKENFHAASISARYNAVQFLINSRNEDGLWGDFQTLAGISDEWVTGYIANSLAQFGGEDGNMVANNALSELLKKDVDRNGWGYNRWVPPDADSTIWVLRLAQSLGYPNSIKRLKRAYSFLEKHIHRNGGVATYANSTKIRLYTMLSSKKISFAGWCMPHICVSAAFSVLDHPKQKDVLEFIKNSQRDDGSWGSYWFYNPEYSTALAAESLSNTGKPIYLESCERAALWVESRIETSCSSPFVAALNLRILLSSKQVQSASVNRLISFILSSQQEDGGWESSTFLRIPRTDETDPDSYKYWLFDTGDIGSIQKDIRRGFTTATVLCSIALMIKWYQQRKRR